ANSMYPGEMYVEGLREKSGEETALLETTKETIRLLTQGYSEEHIGRTKRAFTWLTGKTLP
ncbi:MAG: hypothetical protein NTV20_01220, partial [Candidatus Shapirobacteria bacterium]|nr:hypothetical protein [Candidatus Shapirobacteria bacterium]